MERRHQKFFNDSFGFYRRYRTGELLFALPCPLSTLSALLCGPEAGVDGRGVVLADTLACSWVNTCPVEGTSRRVSGKRGEIRVLVLFGSFPVRLLRLVCFRLWEFLTPSGCPRHTASFLAPWCFMSWGSNTPLAS